MSLNRQDVENIAHLARLQVAETELDTYAAELSKILAFVEQMDAVDTSGIAPMAHPLDLTQRLRTDEVTETDQRDHFQTHAPAVERGLYLVPRVIE